MYSLMTISFSWLGYWRTSFKDSVFSVLVVSTLDTLKVGCLKVSAGPSSSPIIYAVKSILDSITMWLAL